VTEEFANQHHYDSVPDQELAALGAANICSGLYQGFIFAGGASQSAANDRAGAQTQVSGLIVSGLVLLTAVLLMPLFQNLAQPVLGAIVISAVVGFINVPALRRIWTLRHGSFWLAMLALFGVVILGVLPGLLLSLFISFGYILVGLAKIGSSELGRAPGRSDFANLAGRSGAQPIPGLLIFRLDGPLIAINAQAARLQVRDRVRAAAPRPQVVLFDMEMTPDLDIQSVNKLSDLQRDLEAEGTQLWLARPHGAAEAMLYRSGLADTIGRERIFQSVADGVTAFETR
jgi:MFS superfamily sulfate permease-like transporter